MQLFSADVTIFSKEIWNFFPQKKLKKTPQKLLRNTQFSSPWAAHMTQTRFQQVAFRTIVCKTGAWATDIQYSFTKV
jgi:hypothetical protein